MRGDIFGPSGWGCGHCGSDFTKSEYRELTLHSNGQKNYKTCPSCRFGTLVEVHRIRPRPAFVRIPSSEVPDLAHFIGRRIAKHGTVVRVTKTQLVFEDGQRMVWFPSLQTV